MLDGYCYLPNLVPYLSSFPPGFFLLTSAACVRIFLMDLVVLSICKYLANLKK